MSTYKIDIQYPIYVNGDDISLFTEQQNAEVAEKFESFKWWEYRSLQLKLSGIQTRFSVTCKETGQTLRFIILDQSTTGQVEVKMESTLAVVKPKKELFGLVTLKIKDYIIFERLSLEQAKNYLHLFLMNKIEALETEYKHTSKKELSAA